MGGSYWASLYGEDGYWSSDAASYIYWYRSCVAKLLNFLREQYRLFCLLIACDARRYWDKLLFCRYLRYCQMSNIPTYTLYCVCCGDYRAFLCPPRARKVTIMIVEMHRISWSYCPFVFVFLFYYSDWSRNRRLAFTTQFRFWVCNCVLIYFFCWFVTYRICAVKNRQWYHFPLGM